ncbi:MAG: phosphodiesterase [Deltaproteobacteria bacterium CG2_30_63_29]|nr:MAG: phosphodiesterase [Deltaproteobacteria bacterium CG2_30_63_29]
MDLQRRIDKLSAILDVAKAMTVERDLDALLTLILVEAKRVVEADRCTIFVVDDVAKELWSRVAQGLEIHQIRLPLGQGIAGQCAEHDAIINIPDAYVDSRFNPEIDRRTGYRTQSILCAPMRGAGGQVVGVIQALNSTRGSQFDGEDEELLLALGGQAASAIQNVFLHKEIEHLFEGFVTASVVAIESRDPTTSGHSERVAHLTLGLAEVVDHLSDGPLGSVKFSPEQLREIRYAALLHDFGKVGVREHVLVKAKKLQPWSFDMLQLRFELARRGLERDYYRSIALGEVAVDRHTLERTLEHRLSELDEFWDFIVKCNQPTVISTGSFEKLAQIAACNMPGLTESEPLLSDEQVKLLSIPKGSLSVDERAEIESHVEHTFRFLKLIPWTKDLERVPEIAHAHHEKLDGRGYPQNLRADQIPLGSRMMTIADIYDALTASDRPYKKALPHVRALSILEEEAAFGLIDGVLLRHFIDADVVARVARAARP